MTEPTSTRIWRIVNEHYTPVAAVAGGAGVIAIWQDLGPSWLGMVLLLGGIGWWVYNDQRDHPEKKTEKGDREVEDETDDSPYDDENYDPEHVLSGSRDLGEFEVPEGEAPFWDPDGYATTEERIEAMKRQDPSYDDERDDNILDKFAQVLGLDKEPTDGDTESDNEREGMLDSLDPLFESEGSLESDLEMESSPGLEDEFELDLEDDL